jgi:hypothetical protein
MKSSKRQPPVAKHLSNLADAVVRRIGNRIAPRYMTLEETAQYCGKSSAEAVRSMLRRGQLPCIKLHGRIYVDREDIDRAMAAAKVPIPAE